MKNRFALLFLLLFTLSLQAQTSSTIHQVITLGNIGDVTKPDDFIQKLDARLKILNSPFTILLNGDISNNNVDGGEDRLALTKLVMNLIQSYKLGHLVILPGDRDWNESGKGGHKNVRAIESEIKSFEKDSELKRIKWIVPKGCSGPFVIEVDESLVFLAINTQWWNHPYDKPRPSDGICDVITHRDFMEELEDAVDEFKDRNVIIVGHHPFRSLGNYGGHFSFGNRMSPVPVFGSFRVAYRRKIGSQMDISNENLEPLVEGLKNLFFFNKNLIYISGHEHNQQIIIDNDNFLINSGALQKGAFVANDPDAWFISKKPGWIELKYKNNGEVEAIFVAANQEKSDNKSIKLFDSGCSSASLGPNPNTPQNLSYLPCFEENNVSKKMTRKYPEFENVIAGEEYEAGKWKQFWWGKHYRTTWTASVKTPYLDLDTTFNGLTVHKKGGGRQTTSLKFKSADKTVYTLRSVNKDPSKAFNYKLRPTLVSTITQDQTSTEQPYGAMAVDPLLNKIDILHVHPKLYLLPNDEKLGHFQFKYGNLFGMLEENPGKKNDSGVRFAGADKIVRSNKLFRDLFKDHDNRVDNNEFVRSRVFDILVGDWSKHEDNWKWAKYKTDNGNLYRPIPRDRDHVFSKQDGFFPYIADREWALQNIENFDYKIKGLKSLMWQARHMDRFVATEPSREMWIKEAKFIQESITDADIDAAVKNMPPEIYDISGATIAEKMKQRIKDLPEYAEKHYEVLAKDVEVLGSKEREYFEIDRADDGTVTVAMFNRTKDRQKGKKQLYFRKFYPKETKEIRIFGLGGGDVFNITGEGSTKIRIRVIGGSGDDSFFESGKRKSAKTLVYDKGKGTSFELGKGAKKVDHWNKEIYEYERTRFIYNNYFPKAFLGYSRFNGLTLAGGVTFTRHRYDKEDYSSKHSIAGGVSTEGNLKFAYLGRFHQAIRKWDILLIASAAEPEFHNNFYGLGNSTMRSKELKSARYYEIEYSKYNVFGGISRKFWRKSEFNVIFGMETDKSKKLDHPTILDENPKAPGTYQKLGILPIRVGLDLDFRDELGLPYNGTRLLVNYTKAFIFDAFDRDKNSNYGFLSGAIEYYISTVHKKRLTLGLRFGGAKGFGDIPFYKMPNLGGTNGLRGYTGQRFTGDSKIFFNSELRWQFLHRYTSIFPVKVGVKAFFDAGRVYVNDINVMESNKWHTGYGGGIYIVPFEEVFIISLSVGFSDEESFYPIIGFGTPLR